MPKNGYGLVTEKGFIGFSPDLDQGAWALIAIKKYDVEGHKPKGLIDAPVEVLWKLRAVWSIADLMAAIGPGAGALQKLDEGWDSSQRAFASKVSAAEDDVDPAKREAAGRVRAAMLSGNGTEQNNLRADDEVDFGRNQMLLAAKGSLAADIKLLGFGDSMKRIADTTEALAKGVGRGPGEKAIGARSVRIRAALTACSTAFNAIHDDLAWHIEHAADNDVRGRLEAMAAPLWSLLERFPGTAPAEKSPEEAPVAAPEPAPVN